MGAWASITVSGGEVSAKYWRSGETGEQYVIVELGRMSLYLPHSQAVSLHAAVSEALTRFVPADDGKAVA